MLNFLGSVRRHCDGVTRRDVLKVGALAVGGATLADALRLRALASQAGRDLKETAVIQIFCGGGPSHIDMYDLKPNAPAEIRGEFQDIPTNVPGIRISEHLPLQARVMDKFAVVRSVMHTASAHLIGSQWLLTGYQPARVTKDNVFPACGSIVARMRGPNADGMPAYVAVPRRVSYGTAAYLGTAYNPFTTGKSPNEEDYHVLNLKPVPGITVDRLGSRDRLLDRFDRMRRDVDLHGNLSGMDAFHQSALCMITSRKAAEAFDINREDPKLRDMYGRTYIGQNCLLARRLVEAGVTYVTCLSGGGWDTHQQNFSRLKTETLPRYDRAVAALIRDVYDRGLDQKVLIMAFGEFGRTPRINKDAGRDHWPGAMSVLLAGGGLKVGQMVGQTDSNAAFPLCDPYTPGCVLSTMYRVMGIDHGHVFYDRNNRPMPVLNEGRPIRELV